MTARTGIRLWVYVHPDGSPSQFRYASARGAAAAAFWDNVGAHEGICDMPDQEVLALAASHGFAVKRED